MHELEEIPCVSHGRSSCAIAMSMCGRFLLSYLARGGKLPRDSSPPLPRRKERSPHSAHTVCRRPGDASCNVHRRRQSSAHAWKSAHNFQTRMYRKQPHASHRDRVRSLRPVSPSALYREGCEHFVATSIRYCLASALRCECALLPSAPSPLFLTASLQSGSLHLPLLTLPCHRRWEARRRSAERAANQTQAGFRVLTLHLCGPSTQPIPLCLAIPSAAGSDAHATNGDTRGSLSGTSTAPCAYVVALGSPWFVLIAHGLPACTCYEMIPSCPPSRASRALTGPCSYCNFPPEVFLLSCLTMISSTTSFT